VSNRYEPARRSTGLDLPSGEPETCGAAIGARSRRFPLVASWAAAGLAASLTLVLVDDAERARAAAIAAACLVLWLSGAVPAHVPTLLLLVLVPLGLGPLEARYRLGEVLTWAAEPVLALFLGGFALGLAARRHGVDAAVARLALLAARGRRELLVVFVMIGTASLSMWMSNVAAAAMMLAALRPLAAVERDEHFRRALLVALALGANLGGMATPVGTGPNAIAIAALSHTSPISFVQWMGFALPLAALMLLAGLALLALRLRFSGRFEAPTATLAAPAGSERRIPSVVAVFAACAVLWLTEPLHGVPASVTALGAAALLFGSGLLARDDLGRLDWSTLILIAGGIVLGRLLEASGLVEALAGAVDWSAVPGWTRTFALVFSSALLSAVMSNTATATVLIPLAASLDPAPAVAVLIAIGCSLGFPFVISTPPNAMVHGEGARSSDLLFVGLPSMLLGSLLVSLTGGPVLASFGIR
jgi:sodium-dependent dicarboxylate transporter 2/3/5